MKRRLFKLTLFLVLGAIVNIAVAWGCAYSNDLNPSWPNLYRANEGHWEWVLIDRKFGSEEVRVPNRLHPETDYNNVPEYQGHIWWAKWLVKFGSTGISKWGSAHGWPMLSLSSWRTWNPNRFLPGIEDDFVSVRGFAIQNKPGGLRLIPFDPIWPGFAINTVLYAATLWMLWLSPTFARRLIRHKRSVCIKCGYDLRGADHAVCPECGESIRIHQGQESTVSP